jgi:hypothetical protein
MDRYDFETIGAFLATSVAIGLNLVFLQADAAFGAMRGPLVLIPIFAGLAISLSGFIAHWRHTRGEFVVIDRIWMGALAYLTLSAGCSALFQPRLAALQG